MPTPPAQYSEQKFAADGWERSLKGNLWKRVWVTMGKGDLIRW